MERAHGELPGDQELSEDWCVTSVTPVSRVRCQCGLSHSASDVEGVPCTILYHTDKTAFRFVFFPLKVCN